MKRSDTAAAFFKEGHDCAQSLLAAFDDVTGLGRDTALKLGSAFAGGMGKTGGTCGAVTGSIMVIGLRSGSADPKDKEAKEKTSSLVREFMERFKSLNKSTTCRELIGHDVQLLGSLPPEVRKDVHKQCAKCVRNAVEILEEML